MTFDVVLNFATDWAIYLNIGILCHVCVIYTLLGGMKAVIWTDVIQGIVMDHTKSVDDFLLFWQNDFRLGS